MDAVLSALLTKLPELGIAGLALALLFAAWRNAATDRGDYRNALKAAEERHSAELARIREHSDMRIAALTKRVDDLNAAVDLEREARRNAEDKAARALRRSGGAP